MSNNIFYGWYIVKTVIDDSKNNNEIKLKENFEPNNNPFIINNFEWNINRILEASIDITNCTNTNENILSVGNNIIAWDGSGNINLHFYYTKSSNKLIIDWVNTDDPYTSTQNPKCEFIVYPDSTTINIKITNKGLFVNKRLVTNDWFELRFANQIYGIGNNIQVGSTQGKTLSNAKYNYIKVYDGTVEVKFGPLPWTNKQADGINKQCTKESFNIYKQQIIANIDVSRCDKANAVALLDNYNTGDNSNDTKFVSIDYTIFQIGTDISKYGSESDNNFHVYYDAVSNNVSLDFVNNSNGSKKYGLQYTLEEPYINLLIKNSYISFNNIKIDNIAQHINPVLKHNKLQFGFVQGDGYISQALYKDIHIEELPLSEQIELINIPVTDFLPSYSSKKWIATVNTDSINNNNLLSYNLYIKTDLNSINNNTGSNDNNYKNILSIGNDIMNFSDNTGNYNIHIYYNYNKNKLQINYTGWAFTGTKYIREELSSGSNILEFELSYTSGLKINNSQSTIITSDNISYLFEKPDLYIGSCEGLERYNGIYDYIILK